MQSSTKIFHERVKTLTQFLHEHVKSWTFMSKIFHEVFFLPPSLALRQGQGGMEADPHASGETQQLMHHGLSEGHDP